MAKVVATETTGKDLKPGDLFSIYGPEYWSGALDGLSIGERVYVRTNMPADTAPDANSKVYRLTIER